jgi:phosphatidylserine decarboxylase
MRTSLFILAQHLLPHHLLSRIVGKLAASENTFVKTRFINWFAARYQVDMSEAADTDLGSYSNFNNFFTRALKPGARPISDGPQDVVCPADGAISQLGIIDKNRIFQAKGKGFTVEALLGADPAVAEQFHGGQFATVYLSPRDYHRVHMPVDGKLLQTLYIPGKLFSVNKVTAENVDELFARNERLVCLFETPAGPMALVLVGAMIVAGIDTVWAGHVCPTSPLKVSTDYAAQTEVVLKRGEEMGRFKLGSTAIVLFGPGAMELEPSLQADSAVRMGQKLGTMLAGQ